MKKQFKALGRWPYFCLILPLVPLLNLVLVNWTVVNLGNLLRPILFLIAFSLVLYGLSWLLYRDTHRPALWACAAVMTFFYYGDIRFLLEKIFALPDALAILLVFLPLVVLGGVLWPKRERWAVWAGHLNFAAGLLLLLMIFLFLYHSWTTVDIRDRLASPGPEPTGMAMRVKSGKLPDIVYLVLDGYGREDMLQSLYGFSNSPFIDRLKGMGFMVPSESRANYSQTILSLCAALNMDNLEAAILSLKAEGNDRRPLLKILENNRLFAFLKQLGYRIEVYDSGYGSTELRSGVRLVRNLKHINDFEYFLLIKTPLVKRINRWAYESHIQRVRGSFDRLRNLPVAGGPRFIFAHILCPHPPFVFDRYGREHIPEKGFFYFADGDLLVRDAETRVKYRRAYLHQLAYVNKEVLSVAESLIMRFQEMDRPLAMVIHGDHGPGSGLYHESFEKTDLLERFSILNALYLNGDKVEITADQTPANNFRLLLNHFFNQSLPRVEDRSFYSTWTDPYGLHPVNQ